MNKILKITFVFLMIFAMSDLTYALKLGKLKGKIPKKSKKAAVAAVAYSLTAPEYDPGLAAYGTIGAYDLNIAGAPACLAVMKTQIEFALANKAAIKATGYLADAHANKETKAQLNALREQIGKENDIEKRKVLVNELSSKQKDIFDGVSEEQEISKEQAELYTKAGFVMAGSWLILIKAIEDMIELPDKLKTGLEECKDAIKNAKSGGFSGLKAVGGITANLKAIQGALKIPGQFSDAAKNQKNLFNKIGKVLKKNKYEAPSIEEASEKSTEVDF